VGHAPEKKIQITRRNHGNDVMLHGLLVSFE
jgi:hypothetical protein